MKLFSRVVLPLLLIIYIAIETYGKLNNNPLCTSTGCSLAGELLRFNSIYLNYFGALGALFIAIFGYLSLRKEAFEKLFYITLYAAIAFESIMIAYQIIANPEPCIFCLGVYGSLFVIALLSNWRYLLYATPAIAALFVSMGFLAMTENRAIAATDGNYLIGSENCPHCKKVKKYFKEQSITYKNIAVRKDVNARFFIKQLGITTIPVLIIKEKNRSVILKGDREIIGYFEQINAGSSRDKSQIKKPDESTGIQGIYNQEEGCSASILQDTGCSETTEVPLR